MCSESSNEINNVKYKLLEMFVNLEDNELESLEKWICSGSYRKDLEKKISFITLEKPLQKIASSLEKMVPLEAEMPSEEIRPPTIGNQADCNETNTISVDEFLYDDDQVDKLVKNGKIKKYYCEDCGSHNVKEKIIISHSMSKQVLSYIFNVLLPVDLHTQQFLDVGSRLGAVLYGAYYFSNLFKIIGIEMNKEFCEIQETIIKQYSLDPQRIKIINSDVLNRKDVVETCDIIVINVLDFFVDIEKHKEIWYFFKANVKKGAYLISNRSMAETLATLEIFEEFIDWLDICKPAQPENELLFDVEDYSEMFLYKIK